jgi:hypothetical protein
MRRTALLLFMGLLFGQPPLSAQTGTLGQLKEHFNRDQGTFRLIVLVSPTCPACVNGAQWIQDYIMQRNPKLNIRVYSVWYEMYPGDSPKAFPKARTFLPDKRVTHYWDQPKEVGRWFQKALPSDYKGEIQWDAFYLYGTDSVWNDQPSSLLVWGRTILGSRKKLRDEITRLARGEQ